MRVKIPKDLSSVKLDTVQRALLIDKNTDMSDFAKKVHSVALFTDRTPHEISQVALLDLDKLYYKIHMVLNVDMQMPLQRFIDYDGHRFAFIEDIRDMETGAFIDIDYMAQPEHYAGNLHKIMAVLYRPIDAQWGSRYRLKSYVKEDSRSREERSALFLKHMTFDVVRGASSFFLQNIQRCLKLSEGLSLHRSIQIMGQEILGVGTGSSIKLQKVI